MVVHYSIVHCLSGKKIMVENERDTMQLVNNISLLKNSLELEQS